MKKKYLSAVLCAVFCLTFPLHASENEAEDTGKQGFSGFWSIEGGQLVNYWMLASNIPRQDLLRTFANFGLSKQLTPRLQIHAFAEGEMYFNTFDKKYNSGVEAFVLPTMYYSFYFDRMDAVYSFGDVASPFLQFTLGYFPYKYNPDVRDLGEYLYRSGTYPAFLINTFDYAQARICGLKVSSNLFESLHQDLLLTLETDQPPFFDLNLGYIASYDVAAAKVFQIGVGGMYHSVLPANDNLTTSHDPGNLYLKNPVTDSSGNVTGDTGYYSYAGLKLMARFSFDPKRIWTGSSDDFGILGKEDLKLYGEIAILGTESYPASQNNPYGYDTLLHKMPIMLGFTVPCFKMLDVFSVEAEWYGCTYPNNFEYKNQTQIFPIPCPSLSLGEHNYNSLDNWKWAVYAKKNFKSGLYMVGEIACDHVRNQTPIASSIDYEEALRTNRSWMWTIKAGYRF